MASFLFLLNDGYGRRGLVIIASSKSLSAIGQTCPLLRNRDLRTSSWRSLTKDESMSRPRHPFETFSGQPSWLGSQCLLQSNVICSYQWHCCKNPEFLPLLAPTKETRPYLQLVVQLEEVHRSFPLVELLGKVMIIHKFQVKNSLLFSHYYGIIGQKPISNAFYRCRNSPLLTVASISGRTYC